MARTRAFACDNSECQFLTTDEKGKLPYTAKVKVLGQGENGKTIKAHTPGCLVQAVATELGIEVVDKAPEEPTTTVPAPDSAPY